MTSYRHTYSGGNPVQKASHKESLAVPRLCSLILQATDKQHQAALHASIDLHDKYLMRKGRLRKSNASCGVLPKSLRAIQQATRDGCKKGQGDIILPTLGNLTFAYF